MSDPDFKAYQRYIDAQPLAPVAVIDGGKLGHKDDYIIVNFDGFRGLDQKESDRLVHKFEKAAKGRDYAGVFAEPGRSFAGDVAEARNGSELLADRGGGYFNEGSRMTIMDTKAASMSDIVQNGTGVSLIGKNEKFENLYHDFAKEHEAAHLLLGLDEAGADYAASVRLLQKHPGGDTKNFLQAQADLRLMGAIIDPAMTTSYGYGCSVAIESAIATSQEAGQMSGEDIHAHGKEYDAMNSLSRKVTMDDGKKIRPEVAVRKALMEENPALFEENYTRGHLLKTAEAVLDKDKFPSGSVQNYILEEVIDAAKRLDMLAEKAPKPETSPSLVPAPAMGGMTP